ncbi:MAG: dCTP deaminase [Methylacidiphilales bacterium]|nr:dCTP deaminase [Candidatus Methylacidiphilales bacterium]
MGAQADTWIREKAINNGMIEPFMDKSIHEGVITYGLSSYGYDIRISDEFKILNKHSDKIIDPKKFDPDLLIDFKGDSYVIPPNSFVLARSLEYFRIPRDVIVICTGKSTYARCGIIVNVTPLEPEWEGYLTLEISNTAPLPTKIYAFEGIAQLIFITGNSLCEMSYRERKGKYQGQTGITLPKIEN